MRGLVVLGLLAVVGGPSDRDADRGPLHEAHDAHDAAEAPTRTAQLAGSAAGLFLRLVNEQLQGRIDPRSVSFEAPAGIILEDTVLTAPGNRPVAKVKRVEASISLKALLAGEIAISSLVIDEPQLLLEVKDKKLNLLEALTPKKKPDPNKKAEGTFRIDDIFVRKGGFRFSDGENITLVADDIHGRASLDVDLGRQLVIVDVADVRIATGNVRLADLDVPLRALSAERVKVITDKVELKGARGTALGDGTTASANFTANGRIFVKEPGKLELRGRVESAAGAWPDRLQKLPFGTPSTSVEVAVDGPFADPTVTISGTYGKAELYGYVVDGGNAKVKIDKSKVVLLDGTTARAGRGTVRATGEVKLPQSKKENPSASSDVKLDLRVRLDGASLATALRPAKLDTQMLGTVGGNVRITGTAGKEVDLLVDGNVSGRHLELYDLKLPAELDGDVRLRVSTTAVKIESASVGDAISGVRAVVKGDVEVKGESLSLSLDADADDVGAIVTAIPKEVKTGPAHFEGTISGPFKSVVVAGTGKLAKGTAYGVPVDNLEVTVKVAGPNVVISNATGVAAGGKLSQKAPLALTTGKRGTFSSGTFFVDNADVALIQDADGKPLPLAGIVDVEAVLSGPIADPRVRLRASGANLVAAKELLGTAKASFTASKNELVFQNVEMSGALAGAKSKSLRLDLNSKRLTGVVDVSDLDLSKIKNAESAKLKGFAKGVVVIDGDVRVPALKGDLKVKALQVGDFFFGDGDVDIGLAPDPAGGERALAVTTAASVAWDLGHYDVRASYAIDREVVNADVRVHDVDLSQLRPVIGEALVPLDGHINGAVNVSGPLDALDGTVKLRIPDLVAQVPASSTAGPKAEPRLRPFGAVFADVHLRGGSLGGKLCAFADPAARGKDEAGCDGPHRLWGLVSGQLAPIAGRYSFLGSFDVDADRIEDLVPALHAREVGLSAWTRLALRVEKEKEKAATTTLAARVNDLIVRPPGAPVVRIARPFDLVYADSRAVIGDTPARFVTAREDVDLVIAGGSSAGAEDIDVSVDGELALSVLKLFTAEIANAAGTASTHIKVSGRYDDGVRIAGRVKPQPGARLTVRSLGQPIVFDDGEIVLTPDEADSQKLLVSFDSDCPEKRAKCPLKASFGDGKLQLRGSALVRTTRKNDDETWVQRFDLAASGSAVEVKTSLGRAESNFELALVGDAPDPELSGRLELSDGFFKKDFQIRNFVLSEAPSRPTTPLWQTLEPFGLGGLTFNVDASAQNLRVKARINAFSVDTSLRGELKLTRALKLPAVDGAIEVEEGTVDFPRARFEILETQVQFPTSAEGRINPLVHLAARAEIPPGAAGNDVEVPIDLTLDGTFELMQLDLTAVDANRQWSRTELFAYVLFGTVPAQDGGLVNTGFDVASRAALRELAAPVSDELEQLAQKQLGLDVAIDVASGWQLQLGRRLVVEGTVPLVVSSTNTNAADPNAPAAGSTSTDVRVRLLLYDHLPVGKAISWDARFATINRGATATDPSSSSSNTTELRLSFRVFEN